MASEKQVEANRKNALLSSGPKTEAGKARSRRNALKHGLAAQELLPDQDQAAAEARAVSWGAELGAKTEKETWLVRQMAFDSTRVDRCTREEREARQAMARRAESSWEVDREKQAEKLGKKIRRDPSLARLELIMTPQGCDWLVARWEAWVEAVEAGGLDATLVDRAMDLMGVPKDERAHPVKKATLEVARAEMADLKERRALVEPIDEADRDMAEVGMGEDPDGVIRRLRRYESGCFRRLQWAQAQLTKVKAGGVMTPYGTKKPKPEPKPAASPVPPGTNPIPASNVSGTKPISPPSPPRIEPVPVMPDPSRAFRDRNRGPEPYMNRRARLAARKGK